jgi:hypothetical protein
MANEILVANMATPADVVSDAISRALINKIVCTPFVFAESLPVGTTVKQARKDGALGLGATVAQANNYTFGADSEFTQTKVQLTVAKSVIASKITVEAAQFTEVDDNMVIQKQANSLGRTMDNAVKTLASGFSQVVEAGASMTAEALLEASMLISAGNASEDGQGLVCFLTPKQIFQIQKQLIQSGASAWSNIAFLSLLQTLENPVGWAGGLPGVGDVYRVNGMPTGDGKTRGMVINPALALFGMYGSVEVERKAPNSQGLFTEITSYIFNQVAEWNDPAGVQVRSDT